jgi:hypothetical protein
MRHHQGVACYAPVPKKIQNTFSLGLEPVASGREVVHDTNCTNNQV